METYEKKYKEALEWIEGIYPELSHEHQMEAEAFFPELKESEDERVRKDIVFYIAAHHKDDGEKARWLYWLEKQGTSYTKRDVDEAFVEGMACAKNELKKQSEQKFVDKVEPKFKIGNWVVQGCNILKIRCVGDEYYCFETVGGYVDDMLVSEIDSQFHLWTIADAKPGDVLNSPSHHLIWIYKDNEHYHACVNMNYVTENIATDGLISIPNDVCPANRVQRSILFQKMEESNYKWDAERKELKKIDEEVNGEDYGIDSLYHAQRILEKTLGNVDGYQSDDGILDHKAAITAVKKLYKQKHVWSKEDAVNFNLIYTYVPDDSLRDWLKSLKERIRR